MPTAPGWGFDYSYGDTYFGAGKQSQGLLILFLGKTISRWVRQAPGVLHEHSETITPLEVSQYLVVKQYAGCSRILLLSNHNIRLAARSQNTYLVYLSTYQSIYPSKYLSFKVPTLSGQVLTYIVRQAAMSLS